MADIRIEQLTGEHAEEVSTVARLTWADAYMATGMLTSGDLNAAYPQTDEAIEALAKKLERQHNPNDNTKPRYYGAFDEQNVLIGFAKVAKPLQDLRQRAGYEPFFMRWERRISNIVGRGYEPTLRSPTLAEVLEINVRPDHQREGAGTALMAEGIAGLPDEVDTVVAYAHKASQPFFTRFGLVAVAGQLLYYPDPTKDRGVETQEMRAQKEDLRIPA